MLATLRVKNLALVEGIRVDFQPGLNVITGETGAGKSILIGALALLLGERADRRVLREGADACGAEALFSLDKALARQVNALLEEYGVPACEDGQLIVRRIVKANGSSQNLVNDTSVTLPVLKRLGELLVDMHGPHEHQSLLQPAYQIDLLDAYGKLGEAREEYGAAHTAWRALELQREELASLGGEDVAAQIDLLTYRVKEIEEAGLRAGEEEEVQQEHLRVSNAQRILELGQGLTRTLVDGEGSTFDLLAGCQRSLEELSHLMPEAVAWRDEAKSAAITIKELGADIASAMDRVEADPSRLAWLEQRIGVYQKLKRKHGGSVADILAVLDTSRARLNDLQTRGEQLAKLDVEIGRARGEVDRLGRALSRKREEAAGRLARAITAELKSLGFPHGRFAVEVRPGEPRPSGLDEVEFGFAPNVGEGMKPLREIASSGEISRVMLAGKAVLSEHDRIPVMIFDEIDANLGGEMGHAVGRRLAGLGERHQVLCITHLPQVAVCGRSHYAVTKRVRDGRTISEVGALDEAARVEEVARMLGGRDLTKVTLQHAREMLKQAPG